MFAHLQTKEMTVSLEFTKVYYHFNVSCIIKTNTSFATGLTVIPDHLRSQSLSLHKACLNSAGV